MSENILIAVYPPRLQKQCARWLEAPGVTTQSVTEGGDLPSHLRTARWKALLISDLFPGCHGYAMLDRIRNHKPDIPVIFLSTTRVEPLHESAAGKGRTFFFHKPFREEEIRRTVHRLVLNGDTGTKVRTEPSVSHGERFENPTQRVVAARQVGGTSAVEIDLENGQTRVSLGPDMPSNKALSHTERRSHSADNRVKGLKTEFPDSKTERKFKSLLSDLGLS